jgi:hypothetical protein
MTKLRVLVVSSLLPLLAAGGFLAGRITSNPAGGAPPAARKVL